MRIDQFHSGTAIGDAITSQMLLLRELLEELGYESDIYAEHIVSPLSDIISPIDTYEGTSDDILLVHHSMGISCFQKIISFPCKKALIYHNITPEHFFKDGGTKNAIRQGLKQAEVYKEYMDYAIADSNYNRRDLIRMGYKYVDVMPIHIPLMRFKSIRSNQIVLEKNKGNINIIFVGRIAPNKCQYDIIETFAIYNKYYNHNSKLILIGDTMDETYLETLKQLSQDRDIVEKVIFTGKVSEEELKAYYETASLFLSMSEHEGFGVPLLESMALGVPVIAYESSAVTETLDAATITFTKKEYSVVASLCNEIISDQSLKNRLIQSGYDRIKRLDTFDTKQSLQKIIDIIVNKKRRRSIQMQGPFETSYSLAIVNRRLMEAMDDLETDNDISIYCTEGPGDYTPDEESLKSIPHARALWEKSRTTTYPDVTIRNMYPPRVYDVKGALNFQSFAWEESFIPQEYIDDFNNYLDGIGTTSKFVSDVLVENGLKIPVETIGNGVSLVDEFSSLTPYPIHNKKKVNFLHISSAFPRKGVDVLLKAYYQAFTADDDVCLILKTFENPHNRVEDLLSRLDKETNNPPTVEWINCDLNEIDLNRLYKAADCYVQVSRGEGFGLPVAEAMLAKIPVITTINTGLADFATEDTAIIIESLQDVAKTHISEGDSKVKSVWYEPNIDQLIETLKKFVFDATDLDIQRKVDAAYTLISSHYSWEAVAKRWLRFIDNVQVEKLSPRVSMVTTWNSRCGIAEYSRMMIEASRYHINYRVYPNYTAKTIRQDEDFVAQRLWGDVNENNIDALNNALLEDSSDIVHIQFNFGFYDLSNLAGLIESVHLYKKVVLEFHSTMDSDVHGKTVSLKDIVPTLNKCAALIVHQQKDYDLLSSFGVLTEIIHVLKLGQLRSPYLSPEIGRREKSINNHPVVGSYGFLLPHKGVLEVIDALEELIPSYPNILYVVACSIHDDPASQKYFEECSKRAMDLGIYDHILFITEYLTNEESIKWLKACDILLMPYKPTKESASAAIRFAIASQRPTITTKELIFHEFSSCVYQIDSCEKTKISKAIKHLLEDKKEQERLINNMRDYIMRTSWTVVSKELYSLYINTLLNH